MEIIYLSYKDAEDGIKYVKILSGLVPYHIRA